MLVLVSIGILLTKNVQVLILDIWGLKNTAYICITELLRTT